VPEKNSPELSRFNWVKRKFFRAPTIWPEYIQVTFELVINWLVKLFFRKRLFETFSNFSKFFPRVTLTKFISIGLNINVFCAEGFQE
jgi:hypothetical protein